MLSRLIHGPTGQEQQLDDEPITALTSTVNTSMDSDEEFEKELAVNRDDWPQQCKFFCVQQLLLAWVCLPCVCQNCLSTAVVWTSDLA